MNNHLGEEKKFKFLIVEDNLITVELIKSYLINIYADLEIYQAVDGYKALCLFKKHKPDMVFSDIRMSKMNGYELTQAIRKEKNGQSVPIIAITAGTIQVTKEKCLEAGMNDFISKPILQESIKQMILKFSLQNSKLLLEEKSEEIERETNKAKSFGKSFLMELVGNNETFFHRLVQLADEALNDALMDLNKLEEEEHLKKLAHKVKGTALNLGATSLSDCAMKIETSLISNKKEMEKQKSMLENDIKHLIDSLRVYI